MSLLLQRSRERKKRKERFFLTTFLSIVSQHATRLIFLNDRTNFDSNARRGKSTEKRGSVLRRQRWFPGWADTVRSRDSVRASHAIPISFYRPSISSFRNLSIFSARCRSSRWLFQVNGIHLSRPGTSVDAPIRASHNS